MKKSIQLLFVFCMVVFGVAACSDDDYDSLPPEFGDMTFTPLNGSENCKAGDSIVATMVCTRKGRLLVKATHAWSVEGGAGSADHHFLPTGIYDEMPANPTDTLVFDRPGRYKVVFSAEYTTGGSKGMQSGYSTSFSDGNGNVSYDVEGAAFFRYTVTAHKDITVR